MPTFKTSSEKTRPWLCWKPWSSFKETMMLGKLLQTSQKQRQGAKKSPSLSVCVLQREICVCDYCFVGSKWIVVYLCLLFCSYYEKSTVREDQKCLQRTRKGNFYLDTVLLQVSLCCTLQFMTKTFFTFTCLIPFVSSIARNISVTFISKTKAPDSDTSSNCKNVVLCHTLRFSAWADSVFCLRGTVVEIQTNYSYKPIPWKVENIFYERLPAIMLMSWCECFLTWTTFCFVNHCHLWNPQPLIFVLWYPDFVFLCRYLTKNV